MRMHQLALLDDVYGATGPRDGLLAKSMEIIAAQGVGIIVVLTGNAPGDFVSRILMHHAGQSNAGMDELRDYGVGAQILAELGVHDMTLLTNSQHSLIALDGYDLAVVGHRSIEL